MLLAARWDRPGRRSFQAGPSGAPGGAFLFLHMLNLPGSRPLWRPRIKFGTNEGVTSTDISGSCPLPAVNF